MSSVRATCLIRSPITILRQFSSIGDPPKSTQSPINAASPQTFVLFILIGCIYANLFTIFQFHILIALSECQSSPTVRARGDGGLANIYTALRKAYSKALAIVLQVGLLID